MAPRLIEVRQPKPNDVIGSAFTVAGFGTGFEATVLWQLLDKNGQSVARGNIQGAGSMGVILDFGHQVSVGGYTARAAHMTLQVFGEDASGIHPPGTDLNLVPVTLFTALDGFKLYEVQPGDTLTRIAREQGQNTTVEDVFQANRDRINNPDLIFPGQIFRIPLLT
ncbi:LysM peptidoglycan-binding domain-containing protein [[Micrococcus luteus] ATCC 49442]|uniref:LysM peptidoglycan-binding domain-containing protein n=1 Tax=[Micrococcus luteus] ATCC 49442 TaxID=2698727 RepID=UPI001AD6337D|nr:Gmad2 immunoglobulin-like domain-containing protein [[Micrococcus luteus] ATCC 49442]